ncbi:hypothetical protein ACFLR4_03130, partial [Bacteroidota bacterium]
MKNVHYGFIKSLSLLLSRLFSGRVHFVRVFSGKTLKMEEGTEFQVIRDLKVDQEQIPSKSAAVFKVRFKFSGLPLKINKRLSMFPAPFLIAKPSFVEKIWTFSEDKTFQGIYQFTSKEE